MSYTYQLLDEDGNVQLSTEDENFLFSTFEALEDEWFQRSVRVMEDQPGRPTFIRVSETRRCGLRKVTRTFYAVTVPTGADLWSAWEKAAQF